MDEEQQQQQTTTTSFFPPPPPFYKHFTEENRQSLSNLTDELPQATDGAAPKPVSLSSSLPSDLDVPAHLQYLVPPVPPTSGIFRCFGETVDINNPLPSLHDLGIEQVYPSPPPASASFDSSSQAAHRAIYLSKIAKSILLNYLELIGILAVNPGEWRKKVEDLQVLFFNAHHLINDYRAHHSRHMLIEMMEEQLERKQGEILNLQKMQIRVNEILGDLEQNSTLTIDDIPPQATTSAAKEKDDGRARLVWEALDEL